MVRWASAPDALTWRAVSGMLLAAAEQQCEDTTRVVGRGAEVQEIADALATLTWQGGRIHRAWRRLERIVVIFAWLIVAGGATVMVWNLWVNARWHDFWLQAVPVLPTVNTGLIAARWLVGWNRERRALVKATVLRQAAAMGDDSLAPLAPLSPGAGASGEVLAQAASFGPFKRATEHGTLALIGACLSLLFLGALVGGIGILVIVLNPASAPGAPEGTVDPGTLRLAVGLLILSGIFLVLSVPYAWQAWRIRGPVRIAADERGIRQVMRGDRGEDQTIAWHEIRAFYRVRVIRGGLASLFVSTMLYAVDDGTRLVAWVVPDDKHDASNPRLCHLIAARTRLPLRDITEAETRLAEWPQPVLARRARQRGAAVSSVLPPGVVLPAIWTRGVWATILAPFLIAALIAGLAWAAPYVEPLAYRSLVARIHAETPLFHDALNRDDGLWPVQPPDEYGVSYAFTQGGYEVTGIFSTLTLPAVYRDAAVEVTVARPNGTTANGEVGLALRQSGNSATSILFTMINGTWSIAHGPGLSGGDFNAIYDEANDAIHADGNAANQLLIVMRGNQYLCFINGQLVGGYSEDQLTSGSVGLFVSGATGLFTNFTVYPAPA